MFCVGPGIIVKILLCKLYKINNIYNSKYIMIKHFFVSFNCQVFPTEEQGKVNREPIAKCSDDRKGRFIN